MPTAPVDVDQLLLFTPKCEAVVRTSGDIFNQWMLEKGTTNEPVARSQGLENRGVLSKRNDRARVQTTLNLCNHFVQVISG